MPVLCCCMGTFKLHHPKGAYQLQEQHGALLLLPSIQRAFSCYGA